MAALDELHFPDFYATHAMKIIDTLMAREPNTIHRAAAFDLYVFAAAALKDGKCAEVEMVRRIKKMSGAMLLDLFSSESCDWAALEIVRDLFEPAVSAVRPQMVYRGGQKMEWSASSWDRLPPLLKVVKLKRGSEIEQVDTLYPRLVRGYFQMRAREARRLQT